MRARIVLKKFVGFWATCKISPWVYNPTPLSAGHIVWDFGGAPPCGNGLYRTHGTGEVNHDGIWHGGTVITPSLHLYPIPSIATDPEAVR